MLFCKTYFLLLSIKKVTERAFAKVQGSRDIKTLYRYADMFTITEEEVIALFAPIPFLMVVYLSV